MSKTWFITGASSGIGLALVERLLARGDRVAATRRRHGALDALAQRHPQTLWLAELDVTDTAAIRRVVAEAFAQLGHIDVVVSNAGYGLFGAAEELQDAQIRHQIDTNLIGAIQLVRAVLPPLRAQGGGRILHVSSEGGQIAYPNFSLYHATKWAMEGFIESVAQEVEPFGIACTLIEPGPADTGFKQGLVSPPPLAVYDDTPAGATRRAVASGDFAVPGDAGKMAAAIIDAADTDPAPRRVLLGSGAYQRVEAALQARLAELRGQRAIAESTERD